MPEELLVLKASRRRVRRLVIREDPEGDQFGSGFVEVNPNSKIPALLTAAALSPGGCSSRRHPHSPGRKVRGLPAWGRRTRPGSALLAVLADGQRPFLGGGFGALLRTRQKRSNTPSTATPCSQGQLDVFDRQLAVHPYAGRQMNTPSLTWPSGLGTAPWCWDRSTAIRRSSLRTSTRMCM